jgi:hypothetical protein
MALWRKRIEITKERQGPKPLEHLLEHLRLGAARPYDGER